MRWLNPAFDSVAFFARLEHAHARALLLDFDGTLAPFSANRDAVQLYEGVGDVLQRLLTARSSRVILISGRGARDLANHFPGLTRPEIWGSHGAERLDCRGVLTTADVPDTAYRTVAGERRRLQGTRNADWFEFKPFGIVLHVRNRDEQQAASLLDSTRAHWEQLAANPTLQLRQFDGGIELRVAGVDKGRAVRALLTELGDRAVLAYLGDDATDEDAFLALQGRGLSVLVRPEFRATAADLWLQPPGDLLEFLGRWERHVAQGDT